MTSVVQLHKPPPCEDIVATLRLIADEMESGEHSAAKWPATTAVVIFGHETQRPEGENIMMSRSAWTTHGFGPRHDIFTVKGLLATILGQGFDSKDGE
jgi:hypothetical protein